MSIGKKIKALRKERKLSQQALGDLVGVDRSNISQWETEDAEPRLSNLRALAKVFEIDLIDLIEDEENKIQPPPDSDSHVIWNAIALLLNEAAQAKAAREGVSFDQALNALKKKGGPTLADLDTGLSQGR